MAPPQMIPDPLTQGKTETVRTSRFGCLLDRDLRGTLLPLLEKSSPEDWIEWQEIKASKVRRILKGSLAMPAGEDLHVHLKLFSAVHLSDRARDLFRGSRSVSEFHNLLTARDRGLPCVQPLAAGSYYGSFGSRSFLITRTEEGESLPRAAMPPSLAAAAGRLLRLAHDRGLHARDLHAGNLLQRPDGSVVLLDLTSAVLADPLDEKARARALAYFCLDLDGNLRDPSARPLLEAYGASPELVAGAVRAGRRLRNRALSAYGRRAFRACATTRVEKRPRKPRWYFHLPAQPLWDAARAGIDQLEEAEPLKSGRRGAVYLSGNLVYKKRSKAAAQRLFQSAYWLIFAGVPAPRPVALSTWRGEGIAATEYLQRPTLLEELEEGLDESTLRGCASHLGEAVGRLHSFGLRNRDLKFENLVRDDRDNRVFLVDLDGIRRQVPLDSRGRAADLGRLLFAFRQAGNPGGRRSLLAFLRSYARTCRRLLVEVPLSHLVKMAGQRAARWS